MAKNFYVADVSPVPGPMAFEFSHPAGFTWRSAADHFPTKFSLAYGAAQSRLVGNSTFVGNYGTAVIKKY